MLDKTHQLYIFHKSPRQTFGFSQSINQDFPKDIFAIHHFCSKNLLHQRNLKSRTFKMLGLFFVGSLFKFLSLDYVLPLQISLQY
jgi:hypothetical protein